MVKFYQNTKFLTPQKIVFRALPSYVPDLVEKSVKMLLKASHSIIY